MAVVPRLPLRILGRCAGAVPVVDAKLAEGVKVLLDRSAIAPAEVARLRASVGVEGRDPTSFEPYVWFSSRPRGPARTPSFLIGGVSRGGWPLQLTLAAAGHGSRPW